MDKNESKRLAICNAGCILLRIFMVLLVVMIIGFLVGGLAGALPWVMNIWVDTAFWLWYIAICVIVESTLFWFGIIMVYITANQLGIRWRVLGILLGWVPIANIVMLSYIIHVASKEYKFEKFRIKRDKERQAEQICKTRYPILMVHGVFFRDFKNLNYWGRIPKAMEINGSKIYYGNQRSAAAVRDCAVEIKNRILEIVEETGCDKVNVIAHSKGGLDTRAALMLPGVAEHVASLTTINTPHRGCEFAEYLLNKIPESVQEKVAHTYNVAAARLGDKDPDFMAAVTDLTREKCASFNEEIKDKAGVFYQSFGTKINSPLAGSRFPLNFTTKFVEMFDGPNDGLVGVESFPWGEKYQFIEDKSARGISHGDMIDMNRENFESFDVREFYVSVAADLKNRGF